MKISYERRVWENLTIPDSQVNEITLARLYQLVSPGKYLRIKKDGTIWLMQDDPDHRHGSISEEDVRPATELDIAIIAVIKRLKEKQNG